MAVQPRIEAPVDLTSSGQAHPIFWKEDFDHPLKKDFCCEFGPLCPHKGTKGHSGSSER